MNDQNVAHLSDNVRPARIWGGKPVKYVRWGVSRPDGRERWHLYQVESPEDADLECALADVNVAGPLLVVEGLKPRERRILVSFSRLKDDEEEAREILGRLPRKTCHGYDIDARKDLKGTVAGGEAVEQLAELVRAAEWPTPLRESYSSGDANGGRHLERGPVEDGAERPDLSRVMLRLAGERLEEVGLVPVDRKRTVWTLPAWAAQVDERGHTLAPAVVELKRLNHDAATREGIVRVLGGLYKDGRGHKRLVDGSPGVGGPIEAAELSVAPSPREEKRKRRSRPVRDQLEDLPHASRLPGLEAWVAEVWRPYFGHDLRLGLSDLLLRSGLVRDHWGIEALGRGTRNREDARDAWTSTAERIKRDQRTKGFGALVDTIGRSALFDLAWALWRDLVARGSLVELTEVFHRLGFVSRLQTQHVANAIAAGDLLAKATPPEDLEGEELEKWRKRRHKLAKRLRRLGRCGLRGWRTERCPCCDKVGVIHTYHCEAHEGCSLCAFRYATGALGALDSLEDLNEVWTAVFPTQEQATQHARDSQDRKGEDVYQVLAFVAPEPGRKGWRVTLVGPESKDDPYTWNAARRLGVEVNGCWTPGVKVEKLTGLSKLETRGWIARALLAKHVHGRELLERGKVETFADLVDRCYRRRVVRQGRRPIYAWPNQQEIKAFRAEKAAEAAQGDEDLDVCECPPELVPHWRRRYETLDLERLLVIEDGLRRPPTFDQAIEIEDDLDQRAREVASLRSA